MSTREPHIPLFLWLATAALVHLASGAGGDRIADLLEQRLDLRTLNSKVRNHLGGTGSGPELEVALLDEDELLEPDPAAEAEQSEEKLEEPEEPDEDRPDESAQKNETVKPEDVPEPPKPEEKKPEEKKLEEKKPEQKPPEPPKVLPAKPEDKPAEPKPQIKLPEERGRVAVVQHQEDEEDVENPDAKHIADKGRKVEVETQARITATDQNDPNPTPGGNHVGNHQNPGDSEEHAIRQSEDSPGEQDHAPTDKATTDSREERVAARASSGAGHLDGQQATEQERAEKAAKPVDGAKRGSESSDRASKSPAQNGQQARAATQAVEGSPDLVTSEGGAEATPEGREARKAVKGKKARKKRLPPPQGRKKLFGLGAEGATRNGINLNLNHDMARDTFGEGELARIKKRDGERRRSKHRGSWRSIGIERWRGAIENYVASVRPGNQTALNAAKVPFASYLNTIHNRLHPVFADGFLESLDRLPADHPMNRADLKTNLEIVVSQEDGRIVRLGVTRTSGVTAFDVAALESVHRAQPFGKPPSAIVSPDGNVYLHWEFHREPFYACSTYFARPYIIKVDPKTKPPDIKRPGPFRQPEDPVPEKHGHAPARSGDRHAAHRHHH